MRCAHERAKSRLANEPLAASYFTMSNSAVLFVPAARCGARVDLCLLASTPKRGGRSADRRTISVVAFARRDWSARVRRGASHDAGRSPLGAPPWRFSAGGRASISGISSGSVQRAPRSQVIVPGGRCPGPPEPAVTSRGRRTPLPAPPFRTVSGRRPSMSEEASLVLYIRNVVNNYLRYVAKKYLYIAINLDVVDGTTACLPHSVGSDAKAHTRSTKLSTTRFSPALSNAMVSLLPSMAVTLPLPNFW